MSDTPTGDVDALVSHAWAPHPRSAHREHNYDSACAICRGDVAAMLAVVAPVIAERARREERERLAAAARSCTFCGEIHQRRRVDHVDGTWYMSWSHPDGHAYFQASREAAEWLARQTLGDLPKEATVPEFISTRCRFEDCQGCTDLACAHDCHSVERFEFEEQPHA